MTWRRRTRCSLVPDPLCSRRSPISNSSRASSSTVWSRVRIAARSTATARSSASIAITSPATISSTSTGSSSRAPIASTPAVSRNDEHGGVVRRRCERVRWQFPAAASRSFATLSIVAAALAHLVSRQGDAVGLVTGRREPGRVLCLTRPAGNTSGVSGCPVVAWRAAGCVDGAGLIIRRAAERLKRRSAVDRAYADFYDDEDEAFAELRRAARMGHDVAVFQIRQPDRARVSLRTRSRVRRIWKPVRRAGDQRRCRAARLHGRRLRVRRTVSPAGDRGGHSVFARRHLTRRRAGSLEVSCLRDERSAGGPHSARCVFGASSAGARRSARRDGGAFHPDGWSTSLRERRTQVEREASAERRPDDLAVSRPDPAVAAVAVPVAVHLLGASAGGACPASDAPLPAADAARRHPPPRARRRGAARRPLGHHRRGSRSFRGTASG